MPRVRLIHWKPEEAAERIARLKAAGFDAEYEPKMDGSVMKHIRAAPPEAIVIDLSRMPSYGREVGIHVRDSKKLRHIPLVYVDGAPEKVDTVRAALPDAVYCTWAKVGAAIKNAIRNQSAAPATPTPMMQRYGGRTVAQKLGIVDGVTLSVVNAPRGYLKALDPLPAGVEPDEDPQRPGAVTLWFIDDSDYYLAALRQMTRWAPLTKLWVLWRKGQKDGSGINETLIREFALGAGLVDYKVCSYDATWSALALARRKEKAL